jgi:hypothetical protein
MTISESPLQRNVSSNDGTRVHPRDCSGLNRYFTDTSTVRNVPDVTSPAPITAST